jgi:hypothetical protein
MRFPSDLGQDGVGLRLDSDGLGHAYNLVYKSVYSNPRASPNPMKARPYDLKQLADSGITYA